jgi:hypothetical protein
MINVETMIRRKLFWVGFSLSLLLFVAANTYGYANVRGLCCDMSEPFGFPLPLGSYGGFIGVTNLFLPGLVADIVICLVVSVISGLAFDKVLPRSLALAGDVMTWHTKTRL